MLNYFRGNLKIASMPKKHATFSVRYYAWIEIVMVLYRKMSYQYLASSHCLLQMFICKFFFSFYDNGARKNLKITYNHKLPYFSRFFWR